VSASAQPDAVVVQLANRRLLQASSRVLDAVADELAEVRARTGAIPTVTDEWSSIGMTAEFELGLRDVAVSAAYQASMRTAVTIRQRSLAEFLR
jgi:hypothetical protein